MPHCATYVEELRQQRPGVPQSESVITEICEVSHERGLHRLSTNQCTV